MDMRFVPVRELAGWLDTHSGLVPLLEVRTLIHIGLLYSCVQSAHFVPFELTFAAGYPRT